MRSERHKISEHFFTNAFLADDLFDGLQPAAQTALAALIREKRYAADEIIFRRGALPCCIYILREGEAQIVHDGAVYPLEKNELLGLTESLTNQPYEMCIRAGSQPCRVECISRDDFLAILKSQPEVCFRLAQMLGANLQRIYRFFR